MRKIAVALAVGLVVLDAFDAWATLYHLSTWIGVYEGNPVLAPVLRASPAAFVALKVAWVALGAAVLVRRGGKLGIGALAVAVALYAGIAAYHVAILLVPA